MSEQDRLEGADREIASTFATAVGLHQAGDLERARAAYARILSLKPGHADALQFLGVLSHQQGDPAAGAVLIRRAIAQRGDVAVYHNNLGNVLLALGDEEGALGAYREALRLEPDDPDALFNLGSLLSRRGEWAQAEAALREAVRLRPADAEIICALGTVLRQSRRLDEALGAYREALGLNPELVDAHRNLGHALHLLGRSRDAEQAYRRAVALEPGHAASHHNLGNVLGAQGKWAEAVAAFRRASRLDAGSIEARLGLARAQREALDVPAALDTYRECLRMDPASLEARRGFASVARWLRPVRYRVELEPVLVACLGDARLDWQELAGIAASQLVHKYALERHRVLSTDDALALATRLCRDDLALSLLEKTVNVNAVLETCLVALRRTLAMASPGGTPRDPDQTRCMGALAIQCFHNEYVFDVGPDEWQLVDAARVRLASGLARETLAPERLETDLVLLSMYEAQTDLPLAARLADIDPAGWSKPVDLLIRRCVVEPLQEKTIEPAIESVGAISDLVSRAVREQYEENPYPRWLNLPAIEPTSIASLLGRRFPHYAPPARLHGALSVLVAGCGTGRELMEIARTCPDAEIVAVDLSRRSLAYAMRKARELEVDNVRFLHGDILALPSLDRSFDVVICTGVLHHMDDPLAGWRVLAELLRAEGVMRVGLYSRRARRAVERARGLIRRRALEPTPRGIREFRAELLAGALPPELSTLEKSDDVYTMSACRDLLFHACERQFGALEIGAALTMLGLEFLGFELPDSTARARYRAEHPNDDTLTDLTGWDRFEDRHPDVFVGMYQFWCCKR